MRPGNKRSRRRSDGSYWTSYSDMMAGMLFVFALILFAAVYQLVDLQQRKTVELQTKEAQLSTQQSLLIDQEAELKDKEALLARRRLPCKSSRRAGRKQDGTHQCAGEPLLAAEQGLTNRRRCWRRSKPRLTNWSACEAKSLRICAIT